MSMNLYVEHDARVLASLTNVDAPGCDGMIVKLGQPGQAMASTVRTNPLGEQWLLDVDAPSDCVVCWSGSLGESLFAPHPMTWLTPGHEALDRFCDEIGPQLEQHGKSMCFQPHARHVLNDAQSCCAFLERRGQGPFAVAMDPASMIEPSMMPTVADHLARMFDMLGSRCAMVMLSDVVVSGDDEPEVTSVPLGQGVLPRDVVLELLQTHLPSETPVVLQPGKLDGQLAWLGPLHVGHGV